MPEVDIKRNVLWNTVGSVFYCVCQWLITILVVHLESFQVSGHLSLAMTASSSFSAIALFSMRNFQVSDVTEEYTAKEYYGSRLITCLVAQIVCMLYAAFTNKFSENFFYITIFMLIRVAEAFVDVLHGINQKYNCYDLIGKSYILRGLLTVIPFTIGLILTHNLGITLFVIAVLNLSVAIFYDRVNTRKLEEIKPIIIDKNVYKLLGCCVPLVAFTFLLNMENLIPKSIMESLYGAEELGIYASIASPTLVVQVLASVIFNPFLPGFTKMYTEGKIDEFQKMFHKILIALVCMSFVILIGANLVGEFGLKILFGVSILKYYYLFNPIVCCTILTAMVWIVSSIVIAIRQIKSLLVGIVLNFILCVAITRPFIEQYGKNGISIVQIILYAILVVYMVVICERTIRMEKRK